MVDHDDTPDTAAFRDLLGGLAQSLTRLKADVAFAGEFATQVLGRTSEEAKVLESIEALRCGAEGLVRHLRLQGLGEDTVRLNPVSVRSDCVRVPSWASSLVLLALGGGLALLVRWVAHG